MKNLTIKVTILAILSVGLYACMSCSSSDVDDTEVVTGTPVDSSLFLTSGGNVTITTVPCTLSNGTETDCYKIVSRSTPTDHNMGPWCPRHIEDGMEKAGIWFKDDKVYDVSGHFIANLDEFYNDDEWKLYREDGSIRFTETKEGCLSAAKPDVEEEFQKGSVC